MRKDLLHLILAFFAIITLPLLSSCDKEDEPAMKYLKATDWDIAIIESYDNHVVLQYNPYRSEWGIYVLIILFLGYLGNRLNKSCERKEAKENEQFRIMTEFNWHNVIDMIIEEQQAINKLKNFTFFCCNEVSLPPQIHSHILNQLGDFRDPNISFGICKKCGGITIKFLIGSETIYTDQNSLIEISSGVISICSNCKNCEDLQYREITDSAELQNLTLKQNELPPLLLKKVAFKLFAEYIVSLKNNNATYMLCTLNNCFAGPTQMGVVLSDNPQFERIYRLSFEIKYTATSYIGIEYFVRGNLMRSFNLDIEEIIADIDWVDIPRDQALKNLHSLFHN